MDLIRILLSRCAALFRGRKLDEDLDEELRSHIDLAVEENLKCGMSAQEARRAALRNFGGVAQTKENYRLQRGLPFLETLARDVRFALRQLRKSPGFAMTATLTLALAIAANVVVFGVSNAVILHPIHVADPQSVYQIVHQAKPGDGPSYPDYLEFRDRNSTFSGMTAAYGMNSAGLSCSSLQGKPRGWVKCSTAACSLLQSTDVNVAIPCSDRRRAGP